MDPEQLSPGAAVGDWRVVEPIGHGGMSEVFAVVHAELGLAAALKMMSREAAACPHAAERFALEARVLQETPHPGVPQIFDVGRCDRGRPYLVMELLRGLSLGEVLGARRLPTAAALHIVAQLCEVLLAAHRRGFVHRDLKPGNVILVDGPDGPVVKLVDWGIAKQIDGAPAGLSLTSTGAMVGTPRYVSPEQARALPVDARTDVYSLGLVAYELLLGAHPFEASSVAETLMMHMISEPPSPRRFWNDIPADLEHVLLGMLAKDPAHRPSLAAVLSVILTGSREPEALVCEVDHDGEFALPSPAVEAIRSECTTARCRRLRR